MTAFARLAQIAADPAPCLTAQQIIEARLGRPLGPLDEMPPDLRQAHDLLDQQTKRKP